jgi:hypothetical protein
MGTRAVTFSEEMHQKTFPLLKQTARSLGWGASRPPDPGAHLYQLQAARVDGGSNNRKKLFLMLSRTLKAAQTPEN